MRTLTPVVVYVGNRWEFLAMLDAAPRLDRRVTAPGARPPARQLTAVPAHQEPELPPPPPPPTPPPPPPQLPAPPPLDDGAVWADENDGAIE